MYISFKFKVNLCLGNYIKDLESQLKDMALNGRILTLETEQQRRSAVAEISHKQEVDNSAAAFSKMCQLMTGSSVRGKGRWVWLV